MAVCIVDEHRVDLTPPVEPGRPRARYCGRWSLQPGRDVPDRPGARATTFEWAAWFSACSLDGCLCAAVSDLLVEPVKEFLTAEDGASR